MTSPSSVVDLEPAAAAAAPAPGVDLPFTKILDSLPEAICVLDYSGTILFCNAAWSVVATKLCDRIWKASLVGANYLKVISKACESTDHEVVSAAKTILAALRAVIDGQEEYEAQCVSVIGIVS